MALSKIVPNKSFLILQSMIVFVVACVLTIEFSTDLSRSIFWHRVVIGLDIVLVAGFMGYLIQNAYRHRKDLINWLIAKRVDLIILFLAIAMLVFPRLAAGIVIARILIAWLFYFMDMPLGRRIIEHIHLRPSQSLALSFLGIIIFGAFLLTFPAATIDGKGASFLDALFTITSAACVVGLSVVDVGSYFSSFGQAIILATIQVGGLGIMVLSATFAILIGTHLRTRQQAGLLEIFDISSSSGLKLLIQTVAAGTFFAEFLGAVILFFSWDVSFPTLKSQIWWSIFHSVSAFCNAGFSLSTNSLMPWVGNGFVCVTIMSLITLGGLGFFVLADVADVEIWKVKRPLAIWNRLHIQTRVVLLATLVLDVVGMLLFLFFEYSGVLSTLSIPEKIMASLFQAISARTAGFNVVPMGATASVTILFYVVWMFIGASPGSTGGGIKTTTLSVALMSVKAMLTGREEVELMGRRVPSVIVNRSLSIILISSTVIVFFLMWMVATQPVTFEKLLFEVVSAFATVGFTIDATTQLNDFGRILIILLMYIGRIGPLTMALAIGERIRLKGYRLAEGRLAVG